MGDAMYLGPDRFPKLDRKRGQPRRKLYFEQLDEEMIKDLRKRGYDAVLLAELSRETPQDERYYLKAKAQGIEEKTIEIDKDGVAVLRMLFQHAGLLDTYKLGQDVDVYDVSMSPEDQVSTLLNWNDSRHTADRSTIDFVQKEGKKK